MMKRFVLALISVIGAGICGCNIDLAVDSDAAKCIKVGGIWDNKVCKKNPADSQFNEDNREICKNPESLVARENNGLITIGKCQALCNNGKCDLCQSCKEEITEDGERRFKVSYCYDDKKFKICSPLGCNDDNTDCKETEVDSFCVEIEDISFLCTEENCIKCDNCENNRCKDCDEHSADNKKQRCIDSKEEVCKNGVWVFARACQPDWICDEDNYECSQVDDDGNGDDKCNSNSDKFQCKNGSLQTCNEYGGWVKADSETMCVDGTVYHCTDDGNLESAKCINGQRCAADGTLEKCDPNSETEIGKECDDNKTKCSEEEGHEAEWLTCKNGMWVSENSCPVNKTCRNTNEGIECVPNGNGNANSCGQCDENEKCVDGQCKCDSDKKIRCKKGKLQTCNSDGKWEEEGVDTKCLDEDETVYHCTDDGTDDGNLESAKCVDSCDGNTSNSKCSECDPEKPAENCTSGKCNNENVNDWNYGACIEDSGNGETLGLKEKCENSDGDFSSGQCICKTFKPNSNSSVFNNCKENDCNSSECTPINGNNKNELCFNNNLYLYCNNGWINELVYPNSQIWNCYNKNNIRKINEAVIIALINNTMRDGCSPPYNITIGNDCSLVYHGGMEFEYPSVDTCNGNLSNYPILVTKNGTDQCTLTNNNQNFKITTECIYDPNGESSATFIASPDDR